MKKIKTTDIIGEVIQKHPQTMEVFFKNGFPCIGCSFSAMETIEQGALVTHGHDKKYLEKLVAELNKCIGNKSKSKKLK